MEQTPNIKSITKADGGPVAGTKSVLFFWAPWHEGSCSGGLMDEVFSSLAKTSDGSTKSVQFFKVEAESFPSVSRKYNVSIVPTFVLLDEALEIVDKIEGMEAAKVTQAVHSLLSKPPTQEAVGTENSATSTHTQAKEEENLDEKLSRLVNSSEVVLFMKGSPTHPRCGFSRQVVELLDNEGISFASFDILDESAQDVRQGLKTKFDWPTYPQIYAKGDLVGGLDIVKEMVEDQPGELASQLGISKTSPVLETKQQGLEKLVNRSKVMLFMKGLPSGPKCGFSRQICEILNSHDDVSYDAFDILQDDNVRQGLKEYSDWPTYPQLYVNGDLIGGLDIVKEMEEDGSLAEALTQ